MFQDTEAQTSSRKSAVVRNIVVKIAVPGLALNRWKVTICIVFSDSREDYLVTYTSKTDNNPTQSPVQLPDCKMFLKTYFCWMESRYLKGLVNVKWRPCVF